MSTYVKLNGLEASIGNLKLGKNTLILNMGSATECPSRALGLCKLNGKCYALKAERLYKGTLPYRTRQNAYWNSHSAAEIITSLLAILKKRPYIEYVRLSESGDFASQTDITKAETIAQALQKIGVQMYTYSARSDLNFSECEALSVKGSSHDNGNSGKTIARPKAMIKNATYAEGGRVFELCPMDCRDCQKCKSINGVNVVFPLH